jgi:acyl carrier protein
MADTQTEAVTNLILDAVRQHFQQVEATAPEPMSTDTVLYGAEAVLDSLGLVNVIAAVEDALLDTFGTEIWLTDERALAQAESPYRTVGSLSRYVILLLREAGA